MKSKTQELALQGGSVKATTISEAGSKRLLRLATEPGDSKNQIGAIVKDPALHDEAKQIAAQVRAMAQGVTWDEFYSAIQPLLLYAPPKDVSPDKDLRVAWLQVGFKAMADVPREAMAKAVDLYISTSEYPTFPAWGKLRKLADPFIAQIMTAAYRIGVAARTEAPKPPREKTAEEKAAVAKMLAEFRMKPLQEPRSTRMGDSPHAMAERLRGAAH